MRGFLLVGLGLWGLVGLGGSSTRNFRQAAQGISPLRLRTILQGNCRLEGENNRTTEELARHRWHWTMDPSNLDRVDFTTYAARVGRGTTTIQAMAAGFDLAISRRRENDDLDIQEAIARASVKADQTEVIEAVSPSVASRI